MSWDVDIVKFSQTYKNIEAVPDDEQPLPLGSFEEVQQSISRFFPNTDWTDPTWGIFNSKFGSIEFSLEEEDPSTSIRLHVRASNEIVIPIVQLCIHSNWSALDCSNGTFLEQSNDPTEGLEQWGNYLSQVTK
jgi:hypothetical protein